MATAWTEAAKGGGYQVVVSAEYAPGAKDFSDLVLKAKGANADAVFALPTPPDGMTMVKQLKELSYTPKLTLFIRAPDAVIWSKNLGKDGDYMVLAAGWHHAMKGAGVKELNEAHEKKYGRPADPIVGPAYACVEILAAAVTRAGTLDREKIRDAVGATSMTTVIGPVKFRHDVTGLAPHRICARGIARTFQLVKPFAGLSALENVLVGRFFGRERASTAGATTDSLRLLALVGLEGRAGRPASSLTLMDRKRLELARALATSPRLLLLDEFMAGLNPAETGEAMTLIRELQAGGITVLMVEHIVWALMDLSHRIIVLSAGEKIADDLPAAVAGDPAVVDVYLGTDGGSHSSA